MSESAMAKSGGTGRLRVLRRRLLQVVGAAVLGQWSLYGVLRCPFVVPVVPYVSCQNCPVITCHGRLVSMYWVFWLLLPLSAVVLGFLVLGGWPPEPGAASPARWAAFWKRSRGGPF